MDHDDTPEAEDDRKGAPSPEERIEMLTQLVLRRTKLSEVEVRRLRQLYPDLLAIHHVRVWNELRRRGLTEDQADDVFQDIFVNLFKVVKAQGFPDDLAAKLFSITRGKISNFRRGKARAPMSVEIPSSGSEQPPSVPSIEGVLDRKAVARQLMETLDPEIRAVVDRVFLQGMTHKEAAAALNLSEGTLKARVLIAKKLVLKTLKALLPPSQRG